MPRQDFTPVKSICAHLNAFHVYADDPKRFVETNHYCSHLTEGRRHPTARQLRPTHPLTILSSQMFASVSSTTAPTQAPASSASST